MTNKDHNLNHEFRPAHTENGEIGITVKTFCTAKERAELAETYWKQAKHDRTGFNQKRQTRNGNFLRPTTK
jgi:hypothetical protein